MGRSIKLRNSTYLNSDSIEYNRKRLSNILDIYKYTITETEYISTNTYYYRIGKLVIMPVDEWKILKNSVNGNILLRGLPKANQYTRFILFHKDSGKTARLAINGNGDIINHYSNIIASSDWYGLLIYKTNDTYP